MNTGSTSSLVLRDDLSRIDVQVALGGFLAGYSNNTFLAYQQDLRQFVSWCSNQDLELFAVKRTHIELFAGRLERRCAARATIGRRLSRVTGSTGIAPRGLHRPQPACECAATKTAPGIHNEWIGPQ